MPHAGWTARLSAGAIVDGWSARLTQPIRSPAPACQSLQELRVGVINIRSSATCFIDLRPWPGQASVEAPGLSLSHRLPTLVVWLSRGLRSPSVTQGGERLKRAELPGRGHTNRFMAVTSAGGEVEAVLRQ
jgi:hypothetical protein